MHQREHDNLHRSPTSCGATHMCDPMLPFAGVARLQHVWISFFDFVILGVGSIQDHATLPDLIMHLLCPLCLIQVKCTVYDSGLRNRNYLMARFFSFATLQCQLKQAVGGSRMQVATANVAQYLSQLFLSWLSRPRLDQHRCSGSAFGSM